MTVKLWQSIKHLIHQRKQLKALNEEAMLEKTEALIGSYFLIITLCVILTSLFIWAGLTDVEEIARTNGEVVPEMKIQILRHQHGGIVKTVSVNNGVYVKKGQVLLSLDPTALHAELDKTIIQVISLTANKYRHRAMLNNKSLNTEELLSELKKEIRLPEADQQDINALLNDRALLSKIQKLNDTNEVSQISKQIEQNQVELASLKQSQQMQKELLDVIIEERQLYKKLNQRDLASKREYLSITRQFIKIKQDYLRSISSYKKQKKLMNELKDKLQQVKNVNALDIATQLNDINAELLKTKKQMIKIKDQLDNLKIRAPVAGIVKGLAVSHGSVIAANQEIVSIVPTDSKMIIETKISSRDIGHVHIGANVKIKITTYDYIRFGTLTGKLTKLSATTFLDEKTKDVFYKGTIELDKDYLGSKKAPYRLIPGMLAEVDIYTGKKSLLDYLFKPLYISLHYSFSER